MNIYDIFGECYQGETSPLRSSSEGKVEKPFWTTADYLPWKKNSKNKNSKNLRDLPPCTFGTPIIEYLNMPEVKKALNIPDNIPRADGTKYDWDLCRDDENDHFYYKSSAQASQWIWEALKGKYRFLKYSGDIDAAVPTTGTRWWIDELQLQIIEDWRPYFIENESGLGQTMGGYIRVYDGLTFGTIHGAGHMAPQFKPKETYHLIFNWLFQRPV
jgi:carboxypeptidase C (cathepsin A)